MLALIAVVLSCQAAAQSRDEIILDMNQAFKQGNKQRLAQLLPLARGHVLEPYAAYWELRARLETATPQEIQQFLTQYAGSYQEDRLRNDWLLLLGQRRDWATFAAEFPRYRMKDDREVRCYDLMAQHLRDGPSAPASLAEEVRRNWYAQREADDGCTLAARTLLADGQGGQRLKPDDAWRKARLATEANRPRAAAAAVEIVAPNALNLLNELNNSPTRFLTGKTLALLKARRELVSLALIKLATTDQEGAAALLESKWGPQLSNEERNWVWGVIGRQAAGKLNPDALDYFGKVGSDGDLTDEMLAWKARAALRSGKGPQWAVVLAAVNAMSEEGRRDATWVYWKARALLGSGTAESQRAEAQRLLESIASVRGFYEQLALEELGQKITAPPRPAPLTDEEKEAARQNPSLQRGIYAMQLGLRPEGVREWNYGTNLAKPGGMTDRELLAAAQLACDRELWDRCINTSERTRAEIDFEQRYPTPFRDAVLRRAREINLDPAYVYGLIRQESRFLMDARSSVGASGLMQVMPATARWTARKLGMNGFSIDQLNDRETNIAIGTGYLKLVLDDFSGSMAMAAAAYNAGPGRPRVWRNGPVLDAAVWAENVPFTETRDYVKKVLSNTVSYAALLTGQPQSLKARLGRIGPRDSNQPEPYRDLP
ncbi:MAG: lytic transglycosylase domain-containing protein [Pseudomonadota bacterium]|nr:lytic transglycosylase domain-containing protein [Pseudomonadota bacterium]